MFSYQVLAMRLKHTVSVEEAMTIWEEHGVRIDLADIQDRTVASQVACRLLDGPWRCYAIGPTLQAEQLASWLADNPDRDRADQDELAVLIAAAPHLWHAWWDGNGSEGKLRLLGALAARCRDSGCDGSVTIPHDWIDWLAAQIDCDATTEGRDWEAWTDRLYDTFGDLASNCQIAARLDSDIWRWRLAFIIEDTSEMPCAERLLPLLTGPQAAGIAAEIAGVLTNDGDLGIDPLVAGTILHIHPDIAAVLEDVCRLHPDAEQFAAQTERSRQVAAGTYDPTDPDQLDLLARWLTLAEADAETIRWHWQQLDSSAQQQLVQLAFPQPKGGHHGVTGLLATLGKAVPWPQLAQLLLHVPWSALAGVVTTPRCLDEALYQLIDTSLRGDEESWDLFGRFAMEQEQPLGRVVELVQALRQPANA